MIYGRENHNNYSDYKDYNYKLDKDIGAKLKGRVALGAPLPKTISQTSLGNYSRRLNGINSRSQRAILNNMTKAGN